MILNFNSTRQLTNGEDMSLKRKISNGLVLCAGYLILSSTGFAADVWENCANEGATCNFSGTQQVRYGANGIYSYKTLPGSVRCDNSIFGDPIYGVVKQCSVLTQTSTPIISPTPIPIVTPTPSPTTWTNCASEGATCSFSGTQQVRYGANNSYVYKTATGSINCNNDVFGDPLPGMVKSCSTSTATSSPTPIISPTIGYTSCAVEGAICSFSGTRQVRYGASGGYAYKTATGSISCNNETFGDPIVGTVKSCSYATTAPTPIPTPTPAPEPAPTPPPERTVVKPVSPQAMPSKLVYTYFELYGAASLSQATLYNQLNIFQGVFAQRSNPTVPATGELLPNAYTYTKVTKEMVQAKREAGVRVGFTLGGEGAGGTVNMANHKMVARSAINLIVEKWGIIDFIDWNNFEADLYSDPSAMAAASRLIANYFSGTHSAANDPTTGVPHAFPNRDLGQNFYIGSAPGAFDAAGMGGDIAVAIKQEMGLNRSYVGPQAYDGPGFEMPSANQNRLNQWVSRGFPLSNIVWGSHPTTISNSMSPEQSLAFYNTNVGLKGLYTFSYNYAGNLSWVQKMNPAILGQ